MLSGCREINQWYEINCALKLRKWKRILNPVEHLRWSVLRKIVSANCFRKTLHLRCLTGLWIRLWPFCRFSKKKLSQKSFKHKILFGCCWWWCLQIMWYSLTVWCVSNCRGSIPRIILQIIVLLCQKFHKVPTTVFSVVMEAQVFENYPK